MGADSSNKSSPTQVRSWGRRRGPREAGGRFSLYTSSSGPSLSLGSGPWVRRGPPSSHAGEGAGACAGAYHLSTREAARTPFQQARSSPKPSWIKGRRGGDYASLSQRSLGARPPEPVVVPPTPGTLKEMGAARGEKAKGSREAKLVNLGRLRAGTGAR